MLTNSTFLKGLAIRATDGELGTVKEFYFDDDTWTIRYLIVETGGWLLGREVLISPISIIGVDWKNNRLDVALTKKQVEHSPNIDIHQPVSRQDEADYSGYYAYNYYWGGPYMWGSAFYPADLSRNGLMEVAKEKVRRESAYSHLRSSETVTGYHVESTDGEIGHVTGFVVDDEVWAVRYLEVATRNWLPGKKVLVAPAWILRVSWMDSNVYAFLSEEDIESAPEYLLDRPLTREYESLLYMHYGRPPYWLHEADRRASFSLTSAVSVSPLSQSRPLH
jgi:hypothetical protein